MGFSQKVKEALAYYVYALVDPRDKRIFYIGKGQGDRLFQHSEAAVEGDEQTLKLNTIRSIIKEGLQVEYFVLRHNLTEEAAYLVESALIDMLTYPGFNSENQLTNLVAGHHQWDEGIKSVEELNSIYDCEKIVNGEPGRLLLVSLNKTYNQTCACGVHLRPDIYESTRKYWAISPSRARDIDYVLGVYRGIVRCVIKVQSYSWTNEQGCFRLPLRQRWGSKVYLIHSFNAQVALVCVSFSLAVRVRKVSSCILPKAFFFPMPILFPAFTCLFAVNLLSLHYSRDCEAA